MINEFLNLLKEYGNARLIIDVSENTYDIYSILIDENGTILSNISRVETEIDLFESNEAIDNLNYISSVSGEKDNNDVIKKIIAKVIASRYQDAKSIIKAYNLKTDYSQFDFNYFNQIAYDMLQISDHLLVCSESTSNHAYLENYLCDLVKDICEVNVTDEEIQNLSDFLKERINIIAHLSNKLKTVDGEEYTKASEEWSRLYDNDNFTYVKKRVI